MEDKKNGPANAKGYINVRSTEIFPLLLGFIYFLGLKENHLTKFMVHTKIYVCDRLVSFGSIEKIMLWILTPINWGLIWIKNNQMKTPNSTKYKFSLFLAKACLTTQQKHHLWHNNTTNISDTTTQPHNVVFPFLTSGSSSGQPCTMLA